MPRHNGHLMLEDPDAMEYAAIASGAPVDKAAEEYYRRQGLGADEEEAIRREAYREAALEGMEFDDLQNRFLASLNYLPTDCLLFAKQKFQLLGTDNQEDLARKHACKKQNVSKWVRTIQRQIPKLVQLAARKDTNKMKQKRREQLVDAPDQRPGATS